MIRLIKRCFDNDKIRYLFAGGCTTLVNLFVFYALRYTTSIDRNVCNVIAICVAIAFAYFINKFFVFRSRAGSLGKAISEAASFLGARIVSMVIEVLGFSVMCDSFRVNELAAKVLVQFVIIVVNYVLSKVFVFKNERRSFAEKFKDNYCIYIPFLVVFIFVMIAAAAEKVMPFGTNSLTLVDSLHQYLPFFAEYRDKLINEGSLFYTWNIALGSNFMSLMAYYLSSPFNYLFLLFDKEHLPVAVTLIIALKLALSASSMAYYLSYRRAGRRNGIYEEKKDRNPAIIGISLAYALSNYVIGYNWNVMWLDCIMIFPLIILGFRRLMESGNPKLYVLSLFYCLYCNYYIGFIVCLFLVLWFLAYNHRSVRAFFVHALRFALYSLVSGGIAAFLLIPAYYGIMATASGDSVTKIPKWEWYGNIFNMFRQQLFLTEPITNQTFDGNVNLYCGMFAVFAMFLYVIDRYIGLRNKISNLALLAILMISFNQASLNFIWHGMHDQYGIPNRFSFLYIFLLLVMSYDVLRHMKKLKVPYIIAASVLSMIFIVLCAVLAGITNRVLIGSAVMLLAYTALSAFYSSGIMKKKAFSLIFAVVCAVEIIANAAYGFGCNGYAAYGESYSTSKAVTKAYGRVRAIEAVNENDVFYRAELMDSKVLDEATWYSMPSVGTFCSTVLGDVVHTMGRLGFYTGANEFLYMGSTPFTNSLFNVKYLFYRGGDLNNYDFDYMTEEAGVGIYRNPYSTSVGFAVNDDIKEWDEDDNLPFGNQNSLAYAMTGGPLFFNMVHPALMVSSDTCTATVNNRTITYTPDKAGDMSFMVAFSAPYEGDYYINCRGNSINKIKIYVNGTQLAYDRYQIQIFHLGRLSAGDYVSVEYCYKNMGTNEGTASLYMAAFDEAAYQTFYDRLTDSLIDVDSYDDGYIHGMVSVDEGQTVFTSIPYDEGWTLKVDGKVADYYKVCGAFIGIDLEPGTHELELVYTPKGLYFGIAVTLVSLVIFILGLMHNSNKNIGTKLVINHNNEIDRISNV